MRRVRFTWFTGTEVGSRSFSTPSVAVKACSVVLTKFAIANCGSVPPTGTSGETRINRAPWNSDTLRATRKWCVRLVSTSPAKPAASRWSLPATPNSAWGMGASGVEMTAAGGPPSA